MGISTLLNMAHTFKPRITQIFFLTFLQCHIQQFDVNSGLSSGTLDILINPSINNLNEHSIKMAISQTNFTT